MKSNWMILIVTFLILILSSSVNAQIVYSTSFESPQDTIGWAGYLDFKNDAPPDGGNQSVYISGGCIWPHAWIGLGPFDKDGFYIIRCWGKDLQVGGEVLINAEGEYSDKVNILVNQKEWKFYQSKEKLYCPADKKIILSMGAGGIIPSAMLIDKIELVKVKETNSWLIRDSGTKEKFNDVVMLNSSTAIVIGDYSSILKTTDSGLTWRNTEPQVNCNSNVTNCLIKWNSASFYNSMNGIVVGDKVVMTTDGGEEWQFRFISENKKFLCANYMGPNYIYVGDDSGNVYLSVDTGKTWTSEKLTTEPIKSIFYYVAPYISWRPVYVLTARAVYSTKTSSFDGWKEEQLPITTWGEAVKGNNFKWGDPAFIVGYDGQLVATPLILRKTYTDSIWRKYSFPSLIKPISGSLNDVTIPSQNVAYTCGDNGIVLKTSDKGDTWFQQQTGITKKLNAIDFYNETDGVAVGDSGTIIFTSGGISQINLAPLPFHLISPEDEDTIWSLPKSIIFTWQEAVDSNEDIVNYTLLLSADTCKNWFSLGSSTETTFQVNWSDGIPLAERYFWTVIANDGNLATPSLDVFTFTMKTLTGVNNNADKIPSEFALYQNYPNPFNPSTTIRYELPVDGNVEIKIFDITGREVATLLNEYKRAGRYQFKWNAAGFASGIYFYSVKTKNFFRTKKLILLK